MKVAVMQPYIFPYIGYFQLVNAVDIFVFYDDVTFIKNGWINRNRILVNGKGHYITIPCRKVSSNKLINTIEFDPNGKEYKKLLKTIEQSYKKAPYFDLAFPVIERVLSTEKTRISDLAQHSIKEVCKYLGISTQFKNSSSGYPNSRRQDKADRLITICKENNASHYINTIGGKELYKKEYFSSEGIELLFIQPKLVEYKQFKDEFTPQLSIIDILMFNSSEEIETLLGNYNLI